MLSIDNGDFEAPANDQTLFRKDRLTKCFLGEQTEQYLLRKQNVSEEISETFLLPGKQIFFPQQMFPGVANGETLFPRLRAP